VEYELKPHADNWYSLYQNNLPVQGLENVRITVKDGKHERFVGIQYYDSNGISGSVPEGTEYEVPDELSPDWLNRVGWYSIINSDSDDPNAPAVSIQVLGTGVLGYTVRVESISILDAEAGDLTYVLDAVNEDQAIRTGRGRNINDTIQVVDCYPEECLYHLGLLLQKQSDASVSSYRRRVPDTDELKRKGENIKKALIRRLRFSTRDD
jgi:hypothetical protein